MPISYNADAQGLFAKALFEFSPEWKISAFGRAGSDPKDWLWNEYNSLDHFGATIERVDETGQPIESRVLGRRYPARPPVNWSYSYHPSIPGRVLEAYRDGESSLIRSYFQRVGLISGQEIGFSPRT